VHLVGFIIKKFVMMHGHTNAKIWHCIWTCKSMYDRKSHFISEWTLSSIPVAI